MNNKKITRWISALLAVIMIITVIPTSAFAVDTSDINSQIVETTEVNTQSEDNSVSGAGSVTTTDGNNNSSANVNLPEELNNTFETTVGDIIVTEDGFRIQMNSDMQSYCIISYIGSAKHVVIPETYNGIPITRIGDSAFFRKGVEKVTISESIVSMGIDVFFECENLAYNTYGGGRYLGSATNPYYYFVGPESKDVTDITLHTDTRIIAAYAFRSCYSLKSVAVPGENVIQMGYGMVFDCPAIESLTIPYVGEKKNSTRNAHFGYIFGSRTYGGNISYVPESLRTLVINGGSIAKSALYGVDMLESITIPEVAGGYFTYMFGGESYNDNIAPASIKNVTVLGGEIKEYAFYKCVGLENVKLEKGVTGIGKGAFSRCTGLTSIKIPDGVTSIGSNAFYGCTGLTNITIPDSVTSIGDSAFYGCTGLASIKIPDSVTSIGSSAFYGCTGLTSVTIPDSVTSIGSSAFYGCTGLTSITVPDSVTSIGKGAFKNCSRLVNIILPFVGATKDVIMNFYSYFGYIFGAESYSENNAYVPASLKSVVITGETSIGNGAFYGCTGLTNITIPDSVTRIGDDAFFNTVYYNNDDNWVDGVLYIGNHLIKAQPDKLSANYSIKDGTKCIADYAFEDCTCLMIVTIPCSVTSIGGYAFYGCTGLKNVTIGNGVISIGEGAFKDCTGVTTITLPFIGATENGDENTYFGYIFGASEYWSSSGYVSSSLKTVVITGGKSIGYGAFYGCTGLTSITIPDSVTSIGSHAFYGCTGLTSIKIPDSVTSIGSSAFYGCTGLTSITIPDSVTSIGSHAFYGCTGLTSIKIPDSVTSMGDFAFYDTIFYNNSDNWAEGVLYIGNHLIKAQPDKLSANYTLKDGTKCIADSAFEGCTGLASIEIPDSVTSIGYGVFKNCSSMKSIIIDTGNNFYYSSGNCLIEILSKTVVAGCENSIIPEDGTVTSIGNYAFYGCTGLTSMTIPSNVTRIGISAFYGCTGLTNITIPSNVISIGSAAFEGCTSLTSITIPDSVMRILSHAFYGCTGLTSIRISSNVTDIGDYAFYGCTGLTSITIPDSVTSIGSSAFDGCSSLTSITIPDSLTSIGSHAFYGCTGLASITISKSVKSIGTYAFRGCANLTIYCATKSKPSGWSSNWNPDSRPVVWGYNATTSATAYWADSEASVILLEAEIETENDAKNYYLSNGNTYSLEKSEDIIEDYEIMLLLATSDSGSDGLNYTLNSDGESYSVSIGTCTDSEIVIPAMYNNKPVTRIGSSAFSGCAGITSITIPDSVTKIGSSAFSGCSGLESITLPFVGDKVHYAGDTYQYPLGYIFGTQNYTGGTATTQLYYGWNTGSLTSTTFYIPTSLKSVTITGGSINYGALYNCSGLTSVTICNGVTSIGGSAFQNCSGLTSIEIPDSVTSIGSSAFSGCSGLESMTLPFVGDKVHSADDTNQYPLGYIFGTQSYTGGTETTQYYYGSSTSSTTSSKYYIPTSLKSVKITGGSINDGAFYNCGGLTSIEIPDSLTSIGGCAFLNCKGLTNIILPNRVTTIGYCAFKYCTGITSIEIPDSVAYIGDEAFWFCTGLTSVTIGTGLNDIGYDAFRGCTGLTGVYIIDIEAWCKINFWGDLSHGSPYVCNPLSYAHNLYLNGELVTRLVIPDNVTSINEGAFYNCFGLTSVIIENDVTSIDQFAFSGCTGIISVKIGDGVKTIGDKAFDNCSSLINVSLGSGVTNIGWAAFENCTAITSIEIPNNVISMDSAVFWGCNSLESISIGSGISTISRHTFYNCSSLTSITIPSNVTSIDQYAFSGCSSLANVSIGSGISTISSYTFNNCSSLTSITIPSNVTSIDQYAFSGCTALATVTMLGGIRRIYSNAFGNCTSLSDIYYNGERNEWRHVIKASDWDAGAGDYTVHFLKPDSGLLYETDNSLEHFYLSGHTGTNGNAVVPEQYSGRSVVAVLPSAFYGNKTLVTLELSDTITYIGDSAFKNCINLKEVNIPAGVSSLEFGVFSGCESLTELKEIPLNEKDYFGYFFGAYSYKDSEASVPEALKSVTVREGSVISDHAFSNCVYITNILLPDDLILIGAYAFEKCKSLQSINIPVGVTEIKEYTFSGCSSLQDVVLPYGITVIGTYAFENCFSLNNGTILPDSVTKINDHAFTGCTGLESFEIPDSVTSVGEMILDGCNYIRTVKLGKGLRLENIADYTESKSLEDGKHINGKPFLGIDKSRSLLEKYEVAADHAQFMVDKYGVLYYKLDIGDDSVSVAVIDAPAMANLVGYEFPDHIVEICPYAFAYNTTITSIDLEYVRLIGNHAFYEASGLVYVNFGEPDQRDEAFEEAIQGQRKYSQYIRSSAFVGCTALQSANIGSPMIVGIEELAFADCPLLKTVTLGKNIQLLGLRAFGTTGKVTSGLERFIVDENNTHFKSIDGVLYRYNSDNMLTLVTYPALTPVIENGEVKYSNGKTVYRSEFSVPDGVSAIESYAFETARHLYSLTIDTANDITIGDYALANSSLRNVTLGANVVSVGLKRGEGEYTVFSGCNYLNSIDVKVGNRYYCSKNGVLFNLDKSVLIKYPVAKAGTFYTLPDTVSAISSMAFKDNDSLACVVIKSAVSVIGLEAFYDCSTLSLIYFDHVYAPTMIMENAFTTYVSVDDTDTGISLNPRTKIGYSAGYYENGENGEVGWKKYENTYPIAQYDSIPDFTVKKTGGYYAVVVVDSNGTRLGNTKVSLTDPNGNTETVEAIGGVATFTDLFGKTGLGFSVDYDNPYSINVFDNNGEYFTYSNSSFYLDEEMRITYVTLTKSPSAYGVNCGNTDINSQTAEINKSEYGYVYDSITLIDENLGYVDGNIKYDGEHSETIEVSVIGYCDEKRGWSFDSSKCALYQNGTIVCGIARTEKLDGAVLFTFNVPVKALKPETAIEARLVATKDGEADATCSTALNIHVFEFSLTADDVEINTDTLSLDLQRGGEIFTQLFGSPNLNVNIGKNVAITAETNGSEITLNFSAKSSKKKDKTYGSYKKGYEYVAGARAHNKNTYFFTFDGVVTDSDGVVHNLVYNIRFARDHETDGYFYYRCYVYEGVRGVNYNNEVQTFYGAVNSEAAVAQGRSGLASKAYLIYFIHLTSAKHEKDMDKIKKLGTDAQYSEAIKGAPHVENSHTLEASLIGDFVFKYDRDTFIQPVSGYIKGELSYTFKHNSQFVVWVIPVVLEVEVNLDGKVELTLKADDWRSISFEEIKMTLSAEIAAQVGVGCSVASVGLYGSVGTVFVLDFYPSFGVESWVLNGEIGAYVKALWWQKKFTFGKWDNVDLLAAVQGETQQLMMSAAYIVDGYSLSEPDDLSEDPRLVVVGDVIYKVYTVNAEKTNATKYDEYNCYKIAIARWNSISCEWESIGLVDDNGFNDMSYAVFASEDSLEIVFTQQTEKIDAEKSDDIYASSVNLSVKRAVLTNGSSEITIDTIYQSQTYKYLVCNDIINGVPVVVWAENSDNNMFGVSPQNYIDANGVSHVFETSANSIWMSTFENGVWSQPQCIQSGLSAITGIVIDDNGGIAFIVDENGDLSDLKDRVMYYFDPTTDVISAVNDSEEGSVVNLIRHEGNIAYYYQGVSGESGLCVLDRTNIGANSIILENGSLADEFRYIYNADGEILGILYTQNKTWIEGEGDDEYRCDGAAFYGIFYEDGKWGAPVEISVFETENGVYISGFDCISSITGDEIIISFDLSDSDGNTIGNDTVIYPVISSIAVSDCIIDYENKTVTINIINNGAKKTSAFISVDGEMPEKIADNIMSGETVKCVYSLEQYDTVKHNIIISDLEGTAVYENEIDLSYSDLVPYVKHILLGQENNILVAVANNGNLSNSATVVIRKGNYGDVNLSVNNLDEIIENTEVALGTVVPVKLSDDENAETIWISRVTVEPGTIVYLEVPVGDESLTGSCIISVSVKPDTENMEKGSAADNNFAYWSYKNNTGVASTLDGNVLFEIPVSVGTNKARYEFDSLLPADIVISYYCPSASSIVGIVDSVGSALSESCFTVDADNAEIIISKDYLLSLGYGEHNFEIAFADDVRTTFAIYSAAYYAVTWRNYDGAIERATLVMEGKVPSCDVVPAKEPDAENQYVFAGWDIDGDGAADTIPAVKTDMVLTAVYTPVKQKYNVTWVLKTGCDSSIRITETYSYGVTPEYKGVMMSPENEVFSSWNAEILPVTENAVYEACYTKNAFGSATISSTSFSTVRGLEFNTTLYLSDVSGMTETVISLRFDSNVAELSAYSCREGVSVISEDGGKLTLAVKNLVADTQIPLIDLTFRTVETVSAGKHSFVLIESKDMISDSMATVDIYQNGDISGDGVVNTRDLAMLRQYVVGKIELTDIQLYYANFYNDFDSEGKPRINTRDIALLQQHIIANIG